MIYFLPLVAILLLAAPFIPLFKGDVTKKRAKRSVIFNLCTFVGVCILCAVLPLGGFASAAETANAAAQAANPAGGMLALAAALAVGLSGIGSGIAVAAGAPAAIGALSENPKTFGKAMIFVVLGEGIALYGLLIAFMLVTKI